MATGVVTRFAPSPTGAMHLGHVFAAMVARDRARAADGGSYLLRWEDIDQGRCRPAWEEAMLKDLDWLGLEPDEPPWRQSDRFDVYAAALRKLEDRGLIYPCFCSRREIREEIERMERAPHGPEGPLYPGTCRRLAPEETRRRIEAGQPYAWRLRADLAGERAAAEAGQALCFVDRSHGEIPVVPTILGDLVLARKGMPTSYHLAVTIDDAAQGITLITRGEDLLPATHVHRLLQALLDLPVPRWEHHPLIRDAEGRRLAKRDEVTTIAEWRCQGHAPQEVLEAARSAV